MRSQSFIYRTRSGWLAAGIGFLARLFRYEIVGRLCGWGASREQFRDVDVWTTMGDIGLICADGGRPLRADKNAVDQRNNWA